MLLSEQYWGKPGGHVELREGGGCAIAGETVPTVAGECEEEAVGGDFPDAEIAAGEPGAGTDGAFGEVKVAGGIDGQAGGAAEPHGNCREAVGGGCAAGAAGGGGYGAIRHPANQTVSEIGY